MSIPYVKLTRFLEGYPSSEICIPYDRIGIVDRRQIGNMVCSDVEIVNWRWILVEESPEIVVMKVRWTLEISAVTPASHVGRGLPEPANRPHVGALRHQVLDEVVAAPDRRVVERRVAPRVAQVDVRAVPPQPSTSPR